MQKLVTCAYLKDCVYAGLFTKCNECKNNRTRNKKMDFFVEAKDNPIPDRCPPLTYSGPAEQTAGYKCPVCGEYTNPYHLGEDNLCVSCGYELNVN